MDQPFNWAAIPTCDDFMNGFEHLFDAIGALVRLLNNEPLPLAIRLALASVLGVAGLYKIRHPYMAAMSAVNFRIVPRPSKSVGWAIGLAEMASALLLVVPTREIALVGCLAAGALAFGYVVVITRALRAGEDFACNCLPGGDGKLSRVTLIRAVAMLAGAILGAMGTATTFGENSGHSYLSATGLAVGLVGVPMAIFVAGLSWRKYRTILNDTDWIWVLAVRSGHTAAPVNKGENLHA